MSPETFEIAAVSLSFVTVRPYPVTTTSLMLMASSSSFTSTVAFPPTGMFCEVYPSELNVNTPFSPFTVRE